MPTINTSTVDNVAQTFQFDVDLILKGVDLAFTAKPSSDAYPIIVRWVECGPGGWPTGAILGEKLLKPSEVQTITEAGSLEDASTRFNFPDPILCQHAKPYALTVYTQSPDWKIAVAQQGFFSLDDPTFLVGTNPFKNGVFLYSTNGIQWTPVQDVDLTFRLWACKYTANSSKILQYGEMSLGTVQRLAALVAQQLPQDTTVEWQYSADGSSYVPLVIGPEQRIGATTDVVQVRAILTTTNPFTSPLVDFKSLFIEGITVDDSGRYVSRTVTLPTGLTFQTVYAFLQIDRLTPTTNWPTSTGSTSLIQISYDDGANWHNMTVDSIEIIDDEFKELALHYDSGADTRTSWKIRIDYSTDDPNTETRARKLITIVSEDPF
jgi:hypothetical protein